MNIWKRYSMRVSKNWVKFNKMFTLSPWVVYVLSGASIDDEIVAHEQPDLVICEITTRFLVQAPESNYSVSHDCKRKILTLSALERANYLHSLQASDQKHAFYIQKTIAELDAPKLPSLTE
ncbi:hypothetical protein VCX44_25400 [Aeromonas caviae]|uniref:Uncharacterized protein n=1 Tax=Aeromonas caviae TaxID=648 RepID=A0ABU5WDN0_AERCA|nr:hypothetical protein [Aeromonas caviae]